MAENIFILAGESSGDVHAANLVRGLKKINPQLNILGWGGAKMSKAGVIILKDLDELAFMGFWEVIANFRKIKSNFKECKETILKNKIDTILLVDYPGFNLRMAQWAKKHDIRVLYYISPQVWAWKKNRVKTIKRYVDNLYCILPFEKDFYAELGMQVHYFGHPLLDEIKSFNKLHKINEKTNDKPILAILPGSRKQEIERKLPTMILGASEFSNKYEIVVACVSSIEKSFFKKYEKQDITFNYGKTYEILSRASIAIVTSGTATLETALFNVPQVVCYKSSWISYQIAKSLIKVRYISLVNLILNKQAVEELIQNEFTQENIIQCIKKIEEGSDSRKELLNDYWKLVQLLGRNGASDRVAQHILANS